MRILIISLLATLVLAVAGCGDSSSDSPTGSSGGGAITGQSTCTDWNGSATKDKDAYLATKDLEVGKGTEGEALSHWMDYLCGKTNPSTSFSSLTAVDDVLPAAQEQFASGKTLPPVTKTTTSSSN